jgi:hypothetical protein
MLVYSCMMFERGLPICFRVWRAQPGNRAFLVNTVPAPQQMRAVGVLEAVIVDLYHSGAVDGRTAHYRFLDWASLKDLCDTNPEPLRRRVV